MDRKRRLRYLEPSSTSDIPDRTLLVSYFNYLCDVSKTATVSFDLYIAKTKQTSGKST
jgi:hypothetical protein